ncbi:MAG: hypothetical protein IGQ45_14435 [Cyanobacterium sp. T60_A2020_053]|nr:hypothetical protein [Cyanobacterium sp. T60_A2020_053]
MATALASVSVLGFMGSAEGATLLTVDLSVTNQITIRSTTGASSADVSGSDSTGVYLAGFYTGAGTALTATLVSGDLTSANNTSDNSPNLFRANSGTDLGLNIFSFTDDSPASFTSGSQAFTGEGTWNLNSTNYLEMVNGNSSGLLYFPADTVSDIDTATLIGEWERFTPTTTPEPSLLFALIGFGAFGLFGKGKK